MLVSPFAHEIKQTSLDAYQDIQTDSTAASQRIQILHFLRRYPDGLSRYEIAKLMTININAVTGRCKELLKFGTIFEDGKRLNDDTNKMNYVLKSVKTNER